MTKCNERMYQLKKGKHLESSSFYDENGLNTKEFSYELHIFDNENKIATVGSDYIRYNIINYDNRIIEEYLSDGRDSSRFYGEIKDLSVTLNKGAHFVITHSNNGAFTDLVIRTDKMELTEYGERVLSECFGNTLEYHAPTDDSTDHSSYETNNEPLAANLDIL